MRYPCIPYPGGKGRMAKTIVGFMPQSGNIYLEPFAGMGNVFWTAANVCIFKEWRLNATLTIPFFHAEKTIGNTIEVIDRTKEEYYQLRDAATTGDQRAIALEPFYTFSGGGYKNGGPSFTTKRNVSAGTYQGRMRQCYEILHHTNAVLTAVDWLELGLETLTADDFVYLDPPYKDCDVRAYANDTLDHEKMVSILKAAKFKWLLSEYAHPLYLNAWGEPAFKKEVQLSVKNQNHGRENRIECLWKNY